MIKNTVKFSKFGITRRNIQEGTSKNFLRTCTYSEVTSATTSPLCPIFVLRDIVEKAGQDYDEISRKGAVIGIIIDWNCDFDKNVEKCKLFTRRIIRTTIKCHCYCCDRFAEV